jgi:hypothetical protein
MTTRDRLLKVGTENGWTENFGGGGTGWVLGLQRNGVNLWVEFSNSGRVIYAEYSGYARPNHRIAGGAKAITSYLKGKS